MWQVEKEFAVRLGGNTYINTPNLVDFRGEPIFQIRRSDSDGMLGIDFDVRDAKGRIVARFRKNVVVEGNSDDYEITSSHTQYSVTERRSGKIIARVQRREVRGAELDVWVNLHLPNGALFEASPTGTNLGGVHLAGNTFENCKIGIGLN